LAADQSGGLYLLDRRGRVSSLNRGFHDVNAFAWSDTGTAGAMIIGEDKLCSFNRQFEIAWSIKLYQPALAIATTAYGNHVAVSLVNGNNLIFDARKTKIAGFETIRPLSFLQFVVTRPALLGAAEYGLLCRHQLSGAPVWSEKLWSNVGDVSAYGDGQALHVAGFNHGVQTFSEDGNHKGSYMVEGTPNHVSTSFVPKRIAVSTLERHFYWLADDGELLWATQLPDDVCRLRCDPHGNWVVCGFASGRIVALEW
jgi:hypothetical protein